MKLTLYTETVIDGAHYLKNYNGKCSQLHGHSWKLCIWAYGDSMDMDEVGILFDFTFVQKIKEEYDHRCINDIHPFNEGVNPTAENIVMVILNKLKKEYPYLRFKVRLYETAIGKETYCEGDI